MKLLLSRRAQRDIMGILKHSEEHFGSSSCQRYRSLIDQTLADLRQDPKPIGSASLDTVRSGYRSYHLRYANRDRSKRISRPPHLIVYHPQDTGTWIVAAVVHERMLPENWL